MAGCGGGLWCAARAVGPSRRWFQRNALRDPRLPATGDVVAESTVPEGSMPDTLPATAAERAVPGGAAPAEETVEEYFEE